MKQFKYNFYIFPTLIMSKPFKIYKTIKYEGRGKLYVPFIFIILLSLLNVISYNGTGFLVNNNNPDEFSSLTEFFGLFIPLMLLAIANFSVTTITNGKGTFREIIMVLGYSVFPLLIFQTVALVYSNIMVLEGAYFYYLILIVGNLIFVFMLLSGLITIHEYGLGQVMKSLLLTLVSFMIMLFLILLMYSLSLQILQFLETFIDEISRNLGGLL